MKKTILSTLLFLCFLLPQGAQSRTVLNYQVLVRDEAGQTVKSTPVTFTISIREGAADGDIVLSETATSTTSPAGVAYFNIGDKSTTATLDDLDWAGETYFLDISYDRGTGKKSLGCTQIMSVPRAIHANSAAEVILTSPSGKKFKVTIDDNGNVVTEPLNR